MQCGGAVRAIAVGLRHALAVAETAEATGYITRQRSVHDERRVEISLTTEGDRLRERAVCIPDQMFSSIDMPMEDAMRLKDSLLQLTTSILAHQPTEDHRKDPPMKPLYTAEALATGDGRDGHGRTSDGKVDVELSSPRELGGSGSGTNPEQLFAVGYAACFHSALRLVAKQQNADVSDSTVGARVSLGSNDDGGFGLAVELEITLPNVDHETAQAIAERAHEVCPYSNATRDNIDVALTVTDD